MITAVDGKAVTTSDELRSAIEARRPGDSISLTPTREGSTRTVRVTLASRPS